MVLVPFYRGAVVFVIGHEWIYSSSTVLVPFYRGAVVFHSGQNVEYWSKRNEFSSPFIEERLYLHKQQGENKMKICSRPLLSRSGCIYWFRPHDNIPRLVLVPFYRGAVVFMKLFLDNNFSTLGSRPLLSRSGCISNKERGNRHDKNKFSSPFIEERLYFSKFHV